MPLKDFECQSCHHKFEELLMLNEPNPSACPKCGGGNLKQLLTTFRIAGLKKKSASADAGAEADMDAEAAGMDDGFDAGMEDGYGDEMDGGGYGEGDDSAGLDSEDAEGGESPPREEET